MKCERWPTGAHHSDISEANKSWKHNNINTQHIDINKNETFIKRCISKNNKLLQHHNIKWQHNSIGSHHNNISWEHNSIIPKHNSISQKHSRGVPSYVA